MIDLIIGTNAMGLCRRLLIFKRSFLAEENVSAHLHRGVHTLPALLNEQGTLGKLCNTVIMYLSTALLHVL